MQSKAGTQSESFGGLLPLRSAIDRLLQDSLVRPMSWMASLETGAGVLPLDVYDEGDNLVVKAALPGLKPEEVNVQIQDDILTITGEKMQEHDSKEKMRNYRVREQSYGRLERSVVLPTDVQVDKAEADFEDGVLTLTLPKTKKAQAKQIAVKTKTARIKSAKPATQAPAEPPAESK